MAKTDTLNIRIEPELKKQVETTLNDLGMNIADAVTIFLKQVVMTDSIPFIIMKHPEDYKSYNNVYEIIEEMENEEE